MTAEPEKPAEPGLNPAGGANGETADQSAQPMRPKPRVIEHPPLFRQGLPAPGGLDLGALLRPLAAGLAGGLIGAGLISLISSGGGGTDAEARQQIKELQARTAQLTETVKKAASAAPAAGSQELTEVRSRVAELLKTAKTEDESLQSLSKKLQALEQRPASEPAKEEISAGIASQMAPIAERIAGIERTQSEKSAEARYAALTLAMSSLKRAVTESKPFAAELTTVETLSPAKLPVSELAAYKDTGVPSMAQLQRELADAANAVIQKHYQGKASSFMEEVLSRARTAVQVKPSGGQGDTVEAMLGRMESALKAGNLKAAITESASLEGAAKDELKTWLEHAQARAAADEALQKTDQQVLASLTKATVSH